MRKLLIVILSCAITIFSCQNVKVKVNPDETIDLLEEGALQSSMVKIGVAAMLTPSETLPMYNEIIKYIGDEMKIDVEMVFTKDYQSMNNMVKNKEVMIAFVCSGAYVAGHDEWGMHLIVSPVHDGETNYYSNIIVHSESTLSNLMDLKDKKFAFTDPKSNTGKLVPSYELTKLNIRPEDFFSEIIYSGSHDNSIEAVSKRIVDGAAVDNLIWDYMKTNKSSLTNNVKVIQQIGPFSTPPVVTYPDMDVGVIEELKSVLLSMHKNSVGKEILNNVQIDKFIVLPDSSYNNIRVMQEWIENN